MASGESCLVPISVTTTKVAHATYPRESRYTHAGTHKTRTQVRPHKRLAVPFRPQTPAAHERTTQHTSQPRNRKRDARMNRTETTKSFPVPPPQPPLSPAHPDPLSPRNQVIPHHVPFPPPYHSIAPVIMWYFGYINSFASSSPIWPRSGASRRGRRPPPRPPPTRGR